MGGICSSNTRTAVAIPGEPMAPRVVVDGVDPVEELKARVRALDPLSVLTPPNHFRSYLRCCCCLPRCFDSLCSRRRCCPYPALPSPAPIMALQRSKRSRNPFHCPPLRRAKTKKFTNSFVQFVWNTSEVRKQHCSAYCELLRTPSDSPLRVCDACRDSQDFVLWQQHLRAVCTQALDR
jgi:hypothetical protein